jgi:predicted HTH domain antitoxin
MGIALPEMVSWELRALQKVGSAEPELVTEALTELWKIKPALYTIIVVNAYLDEQLSLAKAAEMLNMTRREFEQELRVRGIPVRTLSQEDVRAEVQAITSWNV